MSGRRALVFVAKQPPFPATHGAGIRTLRLLSGLAEDFDTVFVTFTSAEGPRAGDLSRALNGIDVVTVPAADGSKRRSQARSLMSASSWQFGRFPRRAMSQAVGEAARHSGADIVHLDDLAVALAPPPPGPAAAFAPHNVEHRIIRGTADAAHGPRRLFAALEWRKIKREELRVWRRTPLCIGVSDKDAETFKAGGARRVAVCPNGTDPVQRRPLPRRRSDEELRVLFVGTASYQPYERGLAWFVEEVLPRVRDRVPVTFDVVGSPPSRPARDPSVNYRGRVPSVTPWYEQAHVVVVPVFHGSGTRLKVIEAMAFGRPVVSTSLGAEGLPVRAGIDYIAAEDANGFVAAILALAGQIAAREPELESMLASAHDVVSDLTWPAITKRLAALYENEAELRPGTREVGRNAT